MPVVPRRGLGYTPYVPEPIGQGVQPVDTGPATREISRIVEEHQQKADQVAVLEADNQLSSLKTNLEVQALQKRGKDALGVGAYVEDAWKKGSSDIGNTLTTDRQKEAFQARVGHHWDVLNETVQKHGAQEFQAYDTTNTESALQNRLGDAVKHYNDPTMVGQSLAESHDLITLYGQRNGWSDEQMKDRQTSVASKIHSGVIDQMLNDGQDLTAQSYYKAHQDELNASDALTIGKAVDIGSLRGESQRQADSIVKQAATLGTALQEAAKIPDPKLREETEGRVRRYYEDQSASDRFDRQKAYQNASAILADNPDLHAVPPSMMEKLSASEQIELQHLVNQKRNPERATDWGTYASLLNMAGLNDSTRADFERLDLTKYRHQLGDQQYSHLLTLQLGERRQTGQELSSEAKRQAAVAARDAQKEVARQRGIQTLRDMGVDVPEPPRAPGAPLRPVTVQLKASPKGKQVPQSWIDKASKDENYKRYLQHMGVVFDAAGSTPSVQSKGDIILR